MFDNKVEFCSQHFCQCVMKNISDIMENPNKRVELLSIKEYQKELNNILSKMLDLNSFGL